MSEDKVFIDAVYDALDRALQMAINSIKKPDSKNLFELETRIDLVELTVFPADAPLGGTTATTVKIKVNTPDQSIAFTAYEQ